MFMREATFLQSKSRNGSEGKENIFKISICSLRKPEVSVGSAVEIVHGDDVVAGAEEVGQGGGAGQTGGEGDGVLGPVDGSQARLQNVAGGIAGAAVLISIADREK